MNIQDLKELSAKIYNANREKGWWDDMDRCFYTNLLLVITEITEGVEGARKNLYDDHLPWAKMVHVETADTAIRILDLLGRYNYDFDSQADVRSHYLKDMSIFRFQFTLIKDVCNIATFFDGKDELNGFYEEDGKVVFKNGDFLSDDVLHGLYDVLLGLIFLSDREGFDLWSIVDQKLEYNAKRKDHTREERSKPHGKKI